MDVFQQHFASFQQYLSCSPYALFSGMALLAVNGISKQDEKGNFTVKDVSFTQEPFEKMAIAGETGSGKTTLLKMIAGLLQQDAGDLAFQQQKIMGPNDQLIPGHPGIVYLSQYFELRNNYWVYDFMEMANKLTEAEASTIYTVCQIEHLLKRRTNQLSGGEKQRIALARLLTTCPKLLLLDEPFSNLDTAHKNTIKSVIHDIGEKLGITCILVSHDAADILSWADTILILKDGAIVQQGTPQQIYDSPVNEYCAALFGDYNLIDADFLRSVMPGIQLSEKQMLIRPEQIHIVTEAGNTIEGIIQTILFMGSYCKMDVMVGNQMLRLNSDSRGYAKGDKVHLSISATDHWRMK